MLNENYIPVRPFDSYKWYFATKAPTESLGDPAVLLGLINRMAPLAEIGSITYSSDQFANLMRNMDSETITTVSLGNRVGPRNLIRNSSQYWKLFGLIPSNNRGVIELTDFAKDIVNGNVSQIDFASSEIVSLTLPNNVTYSQCECIEWKNHELLIHPFKLILQVMRSLYRINHVNGWITNEELYSVVIPMAGDKKKANEIAQYIIKFREKPSVIDGWYNAVPRANDKRYSAEFLRFLSNFGFIERSESICISSVSRDTLKFKYISELDDQISILIDGHWATEREDLLKAVRKLDIESSVRLSATLRSNSRPNQQQFRKELTEKMQRCAISGNSLTRVLQAAHIKPYAYGGSDDVSNGLLLRADIHILFDSGLINLKPDAFYKSENRCLVELSKMSLVQNNYPTFANDVIIKLPDFTNMENIEWRYENRLLGVNT